MAGSSPPGPSRPPVRVRYYPRRVARPPVTQPLSPGQALHLADDPKRAALARDTSEQQLFVAEAVTEPAAIAPERGWLHRLWRRLKQSG